MNNDHPYMHCAEMVLAVITVALAWLGPLLVIYFHVFSGE